VHPTATTTVTATTTMTAATTATASHCWRSKRESESESCRSNQFEISHRILSLFLERQNSLLLLENCRRPSAFRRLCHITVRTPLHSTQGAMHRHISLWAPRKSETTTLL
jgi:hypothetical protein